MHGCMPAFTPVCVHPPCPVPTLPCPIHALVMHTISPTSLPIPSPSPYTCNHAYTPSPLPYLWIMHFPSTFTIVHMSPQLNLTLMATLVTHARNHPQVRTITLMPTSHLICIHLCPSATCTQPPPFCLVCFLYVLFYFINHFICIYNLEY